MKQLIKVKSDRVVVYKSNQTNDSDFIEIKPTEVAFKEGESIAGSAFDNVSKTVKNEAGEILAHVVTD